MHWARSVRLFIVGKRLWSRNLFLFLRSARFLSLIPNMSETKMADWSATNQLVMSWLLNAIFPKISTIPVLYLRHRLNRYGLEELESLKAIPDRFPFVSAKMDEKRDNNGFTWLDYSGIFFFELASKARSSELVYCVFYMDKPLLLWAGLAVLLFR